MTDVSTQPLVGWIGTGRMGAAMATRLATAGVDLQVWNRTRSKAEPLAEHGATVVDSIADLAPRDVVFTMVSSDKDLEQVLTSEGGLLTQGTSPAIVVDTSTVSSETSAGMRDACAAVGTEFLAAPVSGNAKVVGLRQAHARLLRQGGGLRPRPPAARPHRGALDLRRRG